MSPTDRRGETPLLSVSGLNKSFGANEVLRSIDLRVEPGQVLALIGPSGSGKTTVLRCLNGLEQPDAGTVAFSGGPEVTFGPKTTRREKESLRSRSAMVFQGYNLFPHKTVLQNVTEGPIQVQKRPRAEAVADAERLLMRVGLAEKRDDYPHQLSGGQQQRVGIVGRWPSSLRCCSSTSPPPRWIPSSSETCSR